MGKWSVRGIINRLSVFIQQGYGEGATELDKHRAVLLNSLFVIGFCLTITSGTVRIFLKEYVTVVVDFVGALVIYAFFYFFRRAKNYKAMALLLNVLLAVMFFLLFATRGAGESIYVWYYSFPLIAVFLLGAKNGALISLVHLVITGLYIFFFSGTWNTTVYAPGFVPRFLSSYFVVISFAYLFQRFTERSFSTLRQRTDELSITQASLENANRAKSDFLANMSHELRTPLNHIIGFTELSYSGSVGEIGEPHRENLGYVLDSSRHLLSLISDILDMSKIEAGKLDLNIEQISVEEFLSESLEMFRETATSQNVTLDSEYDKAITEIHADRRKLKQIIYNILSNALKFTSSEGRVAIQICRQSDNSAMFTIADTGRGIDGNEIEHLFEPFYQAKKSSEGVKQGTGLGLSLTKELVELHGGRIWLDSEGIGKGTTCHFTIPQSTESNNKTEPMEELLP